MISKEHFDISNKSIWQLHTESNLNTMQLSKSWSTAVTIMMITGNCAKNTFYNGI